MKWETSEKRKGRLMVRVERYLYMREIKAPTIMTVTEGDMIMRALADLDVGEIVEAFAEFPAVAAACRRLREDEAVGVVTVRSVGDEDPS